MKVSEFVRAISEGNNPDAEIHFLTDTGDAHSYEHVAVPTSDHVIVVLEPAEPIDDVTTGADEAAPATTGPGDVTAGEPGPGPAGG